MKTRSRLPLPRLGHDGLLAAAGAAGYAPACAYESGGEWDAALLERWRNRRKAQGMRLRALPSPVACLLALVLVVL